MFNLRKFSRKLALCDVISFDLFDTLVLRPFVDPADLFTLIEQNQNCRNFRAERIKAERVALGKKMVGQEEVTLDEIYQEVPLELRHLKEIELAYEFTLCMPNPEMRPLFEEAADRRKKIIITSDSYLPQSFLMQIIDKCGYREIDDIFVSSTYSKTKRTGSLFEIVENKLGLHSSKLFHVGDNSHSDVMRPKTKGWNSLLITPPLKRYLAKSVNRRLIKLLQSTEKEPFIRKDLSILTAISALDPSAGQPFWKEIGFHFAGPVVHSFAEWIYLNVKRESLGVIAFVARDGFYLQKAMKTIAPDLPTQYVYASRKIVDQLSRDALLKESYVDALKRNLPERKVAIVDAGTNSFTTQRFFQSLGFQTNGLYWCTGREADEISYRKFYDGGMSQADMFMGVGLIEFFMTAPHPPIGAIEIEHGEINPQFVKSVHHEEMRRINAIRDLGEGIQRRVDLTHQIFCKIPTSVCAKSIILWNDLWLAHPTRAEIHHFNKIMHAADDSHLSYREQFKLRPESGMLAFLKRFSGVKTLRKPYRLVARILKW